MKKVLSLLLSVIMVVSVFATVPFSAGAATGAVKMKHYMTYSMKQSDYSKYNQPYGYNAGCCAMSYAIGLSIVTGQSVEPTQFWYNGTTNYTMGKIGGYVSYNANTLYQSIYSGKPVMLHYKNGSNQHWVLVIGASDNSLSTSSFICIDPVTGTERTLNNCWAFGGSVSGMRIFTDTAKTIEKDENSQPSDKPGKPYLTSNKSLYPYGEDVTLSWEKTIYANNYWLDFYKDGVRIDGRIVKSPLVLTDLEPGKYIAYITANNAFGHTVSNECIFEVFNSAPGKPYLTSNKSLYSYGEDVTLSWEKTIYANNYWLDFYKDGVRIDGRTVKSPLVLTDLEPGKYIAYITANNVFGHTVSNECKFEVKNKEDISPELMLGDVDGDKDISVMDATLIQLAISRQVTLTDVQINAADTDQDGDMNIMDATAIQLYVAKIITEF